MASTITPRVKIPKSARPGEIITIKTLISHRMESGQRRDDDGSIVPRAIINRFVVAFEGETVLDVAMEPGISTNPYFQFHARVPAAGEFQFTWYDDDGSIYRTSRSIALV